MIKKLIPLKFKDVLRDALAENARRGNFIRIYPSRGSDMYDKFFSGPRPYNRFLYKCLYTEEIIPSELNEGLDSAPLNPRSDLPYNLDQSIDAPSNLKNTQSSKDLGENPSKT